MRVLITGSSGRIGSEVTRLALEAGHHVVGMDLAPPSVVEPTEFHQGAVTSFETTSPVFEGLDAVIHLGAYMSWVADQAQAVFHAGTATTFHLLEAVRRNNLRRFVFASTGDAYPESAPAYLPLDEHHPLRPRSIYGLTKMLGEQIVDFHARTTGLPTVVLRFPATYDPTELLDPDNMFAGSRFQLHLRLRREISLGNEAFAQTLQTLADQAGSSTTLVAVRDVHGTHARMTISTPTDVARAVLLALDHPAAPGQTFGVGPDNPIDLFDFAHKLGAATGIPVVEATAPVISNYWTLNARAKEVLGFESRATEETILEAAARAWQLRRANGVGDDQR